jgi:hypothetical protein
VRLYPAQISFDDDLRDYGRLISWYSDILQQALTGSSKIIGGDTNRLVRHE